MNDQSAHRHHWQLNSDITFLNHGSFGACPTVVLEAQRCFRDQLERDPIAFLAPERDLEPKLDLVRDKISNLLHADSADVAFVRNTTDGVNAVMRSFQFCTGDEVVITNHGYNACNNAVQFAAQRAGATVRVADVPFPIDRPQQVVQAIEERITSSTRLLLVDHVTSLSGLVLPLRKIVEMAKSHGVRVLVDGAHAPGMIAIDLPQIDADYYTGNHHKWLCGPKASGFLWVNPKHQESVRPTVISHAANRTRPNRSRFVAEFDWCGTYDPTPLLAMESAIDFLASLVPGGYSALLQANHQLAQVARESLLSALSIDAPAPLEMIGALVAVPLPIEPGEAESIKQSLWDQHKIEVPVYYAPSLGKSIMRTSSHAYNCPDEYARLCEAVRHLTS